MNLPLQDIERLLENTKNSLSGAYHLADQAPSLARQLIDIMKEREEVLLQMRLATTNLTHEDDKDILAMIERWIALLVTKDQYNDG